MQFTSLSLSELPTTSGLHTPPPTLAPEPTAPALPSVRWNEPKSVVMLHPAHGSRDGAMKDKNIEALVRQHLPTVFRVLRRAGVALADCDDVTQEVFLTVARRQSDIEIGKERAFCVGVAVRKASDYRRAQARRPRLIDTAEFEVVSHALNPEQQSALVSQLTRLDLLLQKLAPEQQEVFILVSIEELSFEEAAHALGVPQGTVSSRLHRARAALEMLIQRQHPEGA